MAACDLSNFAIPAGELNRPGNWKLKGSITWTGQTRGQKERLLNGKLIHQILKLEAVSRSTSRIKVKPTWYRAGVSHLLLGQTEVHSEYLPLGESYLIFPLADQSYRIKVWPRQYLPNLKVKVREYIGPLSVSPAVAVESIAQIQDQVNHITETLEQTGELTEGWFPSVPELD